MRTQNDHRRGPCFAHYDVDAFFISVERELDKGLAGKPLMIGGTGGRGVVAACSYETRPYGIYSGMPMAYARRLCPHAIVLKGNYDAYSSYSKLFGDIVRERAPRCEQASVDEVYVDLEGMEQFFGGFKWATNLRKELQGETGLPITMGVATSKALAKMATNASKPQGERYIAPGEELQFLDGLPVSSIPSVGPVLTSHLAEQGIQSIRKLREIPLDVLEASFGKLGTMLWQRARGIDESKVIEQRLEKSISTQLTFPADSIDLRKIQTTLMRMVEDVSFELRKAQRLTACISVEVRYADMTSHSKQRKIPHTASTSTLKRHARELLTGLVRRQRMRRIGVRFSNLAYGGHQANLFFDTLESLNLDQATDLIQMRFGRGAVRSASALGGFSHGEESSDASPAGRQGGRQAEIQWEETPIEQK